MGVQRARQQKSEHIYYSARAGRVFAPAIDGHESTQGCLVL